MRSRRYLLVILTAAVLLVIAVGGYRWWRFNRVHVETDDAYVGANVALITPRVAGTVIELPVKENWQVDTGDLLARLDPADYELELRAAEAAVAQARQTIAEERAQVQAADSDVQLAEAELDLAQRDDERVEQLFRQKVVSDDELDRSRTNLRVARARLTSARQQAIKARAALGIPPEAPDTEAPALRRATAARDMAALQLSYTELRAPLSGLIDARTVQLGQHVDPGQALMRVVPLQNVYVEANFKETQITDIRVGQPVTIVADAYPGFEYRGVVDGLAPGTGASSALLPPENATGNWIKVVQRLPVRIHFSEPPPADHPLRIGLSVVAIVDVHDTSGPTLAPLSQTERSK
jgi:membrane fusion protein, multidrug efflux system